MKAYAGAHRRQRAQGRDLQLLFVCLGVFMVYLDSTIVNVALPDIQRDLNVGVTDLQWVFDGYVLTFACFLLTAGTLGDMLGRRRVFLAGLAGFTLTSVGCALAGNISVLLAARALQGICGAVMITSSLTLVNTMYNEPTARARAIGIWAGIGGLALAVGPVLGGALLERFSWQSIFWLNAPIGVVAVAALLRLLPATDRRQARHLDLLGQLLFVAGIGALTYALIQASTDGWTAPNIVSAFTAAAVALLLFVYREARFRQPMLPLDFFRNRTLVMACAVNLLSLYGLFGAIFLLTIYLQEINRLSPIQTGVRFLALTVAIMVASILAPKIAARVGSKAAITTGSLLAGVGLLGLVQLRMDSGFGTYGWALVLIGVGVSLAGAPATVALLASVPRERAGTVAGTSQAFRQVGAVFGIALSGTIALQYVRHNVPSALAKVAMADPVRGRVIDALGHGQLSALGTLPAQLRGAVLSQTGPVLVDGIHLAMVVAAAGPFLGAVAALVLAPSQRRVVMMAPAAAPEVIEDTVS